MGKILDRHERVLGLRDIENSDAHLVLSAVTPVYVARLGGDSINDPLHLWRVAKIAVYLKLVARIDSNRRFKAVTELPIVIPPRDIEQALILGRGAF